jgi:multimeric flavodoxin WrbA
MNIVVLNGSPKGNPSITLKLINYIQKKIPSHKYKILNIAQKIKKISNDKKAFNEIIDIVKSSDGVIWSFPLYIMNVCSQYQRFIELVFERDVKTAFQNKYTAAVSTSIHFYDNLAHNYINAICDDLNMKYVGYFSVHMMDLFRKEKTRKKLITFADNYFNAIKNKKSTIKNYSPLIYRSFDYHPDKPKIKIDTTGKKIIILTDSLDKNTNLEKMISRFNEALSPKAEVVNLYDIDIKGPCLECLRCGFDNICSYHNKDSFMNFYNTRLKAADIIIIAGNISNRYLSVRWKLFWDRSFFNTHTPSLTGKQIGFIISGPLSQIPNLRQTFEGWMEFQRANTVGFITDEFGSSKEIDSLLQSFAEDMLWFSNNDYIKPRTFLGIGGMKIFRDDIWGRLRLVFQADYRFYKKNKFYDFPQKDIRSRLMNAFMIPLTRIPIVRKKFPTVMKTMASKRFKKIIDNK